MILLLDTTVLVDVLRKRATTLTMLASAVRLGHELATSTMNVAEVYVGIREDEEAATQDLVGHLIAFPVTASIAERGGRLKNEWSRRGRNLRLPDMIVAATALEHGIGLVTENRKDFPMPGISFYPVA